MVGERQHHDGAIVLRGRHRGIQRGDELPTGRKAIGALRGHCPGNHLVELCRQVTALAPERWRRTGHPLRQHRHHRPAKRHLPREALVEHAPERVNVAATVDGFAPHLFGTEVRWRADHLAGLGQPGVFGLAHRAGNAEVRHDGVALAEQDVLGLDVAVDDPGPVGIVQRVGHLAHDPECQIHRQGALPVEPIAERFAVDERHHVEQDAGGRAGIMQRQDMRMLQVGGGLDLAQETFRADRGGDLLAQHLDGDLAIVLQIVGQVDGGHATRAELALDAVAVAQGGREAQHRVGVGHPIP